MNWNSEPGNPRCDNGIRPSCSEPVVESSADRSARLHDAQCSDVREGAARDAEGRLNCRVSTKGRP